jgi:ribosomal protein S18 acetylase RimI-like enzyme
MKIREATQDDRARLRELYEEFFHELPPPPDMPVDIEHELTELDGYLERQMILVAEDGDEIVGFALARHDEHPGFGELSDLYVSPGSRRQGAARRLIREVAERLRAQGTKVVMVHVGVDNANARATYERLGFRTNQLLLYAPVEQLLERASHVPRGESYGSVHVQTDDIDAVGLAVRKYIPRFGKSGGSVVVGPRNGWIAVYDELCDREPSALRRLGAELSNATGAVTVATGVEEGAVVRYVVLERGSVVDEYLSVPEYYKPLPPGDAIALGANSTVVARLTGADPKRFKEVARTAASPEELPPPKELLEQIADLMGLSGAGRGFEAAAAEPGTQTVSHR